MHRCGKANYHFDALSKRANTAADIKEKAALRRAAFCNDVLKNYDASVLPGRLLPTGGVPSE